MRTITDHVVENDSVNHQVDVTVTDEQGAGGANHRYHMVWLNDQSWKNEVPNSLDIHFQEGPIREVGVNGITHEILLAIVIDRLRSFQAGPYSCRDNAVALTHCEEALMWLQRRTRERIKRGVEGTHAA